MSWSQGCVGFALVYPAPCTVPGTQRVPSKGLLNGGMGDLLLVSTFWSLLILPSLVPNRKYPSLSLPSVDHKDNNPQFNL